MKPKTDMRLTNVLICLFAPFVLSAILAYAAEPAAQPATEAATAKPAPTPLLLQLVFADSVEEAQKLEPDTQKGFLVLHGQLTSANATELEKRLAAGKGQPITEQLLTAIVQVVTLFFRQQDFPIAEVVIPQQSIAKGTVRVAVKRGKFREIIYKGSNNWFSENLIRDILRVQKGEIVRLSELDQAVNWVNSNPFRRVRVHVQPVADTGEADLHIGVEERVPLRLGISYENSGNDILGEDRYTAAVTYGNLWGKDHQASYQYTTARDSRILQAHAFDYRIPLPWRHILLISGNTAKVNAALFGGYFNQQGRSTHGELKYVAPVKIKGWTAEGSGVFGFKQSNNNLEFGGYDVFSSTTESFTGSLGLTAVRPDNRGRWVLSGTLVASPGNINSRNSDTAFSKSRFNAKARYAYGQILVQRVTSLAPSLSLMNRALLQGGGSTNLLPSEQLSIGGSASVRGYKERIYSGESGIVLNQEVHKQLPARILTQRLPSLESSLVFFWDYGRTFVHEVQRSESKNSTLQSFGLGFNFSMGRYLNGAFDYGRQMQNALVTDGQRGRFHARVTISY